MSRLARLPAAAAHPRWAAAALLASFVVFGARLFRLVDRNAVDLLFRDQWHIMAPEFDGRGLWAMIRFQLGPSREGLGGLWNDAVYWLTGWNVRADCFLTAGLLVAAAALALDVKRRIAGRLDAFDAAIPPLFLGLATFELFAVTPNAAHGALPLLLAVAGAWALVRDSWSLAGAVGVVSSHTGFATYLAGVIAGIALLVAIRDRSRRALLACVAVGAAIAFFFVGYRFEPALDCFEFPHPRPYEYVYFVGFLLMRPFGSFQTAGVLARTASVVVACGALALGGAAIIRTWSFADARLWRAAAMLVWFSIAFAAACAVGRVCAGLAGALTSRYVPYALPFWLAVFLLLRGTWTAGSARSAALALLLLAAFVAKELDPTMNVSTARSYSEPKRRWRACYLRIHDWRACDKETGFPISFSPDSVERGFDFLRAHRLNVYRDSP